MSAGIKHYHAGLAAAHVVGGTGDGTTETQFHASGGTSVADGEIPVKANTLRVGDLFDCFAVIDCPTTNSNDTLTLKAYLGPAGGVKTGVLLADQTAIDVANNDEIGLQFKVAVEAIGPGGTARFSVFGISAADAATALSKTAVKSATDAQVSTAVDLAIGVTGTWSASSADNSARLRSLHAVKYPAQISK